MKMTREEKVTYTATMTEQEIRDIQKAVEYTMSHVEPSLHSELLLRLEEIDIDITNIREGF